MSTASTSLVLDALRNLGSTPFRIDWFGDITYGGRFGGRSPLVNISLSRGSDGRWTRSATADGGFPITVAVPVAYLRLVRRGDIWVLGQRAGTDVGSVRATFADILVDETTTETRPAGLPVDEVAGEPHYLLPFSEFDGHRGHTGAFCVCVRLGDGTSLVVPCMEVIRFYFGASGLLLTRLFSGAFASDNLYTWAKCNRVTKTANLTLAEGLPHSAATTVARIAFDRQAKKAASWIAKAGVAAAANGERYYPKTTFPFIGRTNLTADGRWLSLGTKKVFLVERLLQCTYPFPFERLYVRSAMRITGDGPRGTDSKLRRRKSATPTSNPQGHERTLLEGYVTGALLHMAVGADDSLTNPFPDLVGKSVHRIEDAMPSQTGHAAALDPNSGELSAGCASSSDAARGAELVAVQMPQFGWTSMPEEVDRFLAAFASLTGSGEILATVVMPLSNEQTSQARSPFLRGDWIVRSPDEHSRAIWCAKIVVGGSAFPSHTLVTIMCECSGISEKGKLVLVRLDGEVAKHDETVRDICAELVAADAAPLEQRRPIVLDALCDAPEVCLSEFLRTHLKTPRRSIRFVPLDRTPGEARKGPESP